MDKERRKLKNGATYRSIGLYREVVVNVPKKSDYMRWVQGGFPIADVADHWAHGKQFGRGDGSLPVILNCNYFGFDEFDLGRKIVADVELKHKTTASGNVYLMLGITKVSGSPRYEMKFLSANQMPHAHLVKFIILGSDHCIIFLPRSAEEEQAKAAAA